MKAPDQTKQIRQFSAAMAVFLGILGSIPLFKGNPANISLYVAGVAFLVVGLAVPVAVKPIFWLWMKIAHALGWFNTRLLLGIVFYVIFTPIALVLRLLRVDMLDRRIEPDRPSYWHRRENPELKPEDYERQF